MSERPQPRLWELLLDVVPLALSALLAGRILDTWGRRLSHPFDLEWMEGGMLGHAWRLSHGLPLYAAPSADWVPYIYPPGYSAVLGALGGLFGLDYTLGRAISVASTLLAAAALVVLGGRHGNSWVAGLCSAAAFLGCYRAGGAFFDLVRPDMLAMALTAWCVVAVADGRRGTLYAGGLLLAAAFVVKHNFAILGIPLTLAVWARDGWRSGMRLGLSAALPAGLTTLWLQWRSGGYFLVYLLEVPASHPSVLNRATVGVPGELSSVLLPAMVLSALFLAVRLRAHHPEVHPAALWGLPTLVAAGLAVWGLAQPAPRGVGIPEAPALTVGFLSLGAGLGLVCTGAFAALVTRRVPWRLWLGIGVGGTLVVVACVMRAHHGGFLNVLIPAFWAICAALAVAVGGLRSRGGAGMRVATAVVLAVQVAWPLVDLRLDDIWPSQEDVDSGNELVTLLTEQCDGPIFSPYSAWLPVQAGRAPSTALIALWDLDHKTGPLKEGLKAFTAAAAEQHWACIVDGGSRPLGYRIQEHYEVAVRPVFPRRALMPRTGWRVRPREILVPRPVER